MNKRFFLFLVIFSGLFASLNAKSNGEGIVYYKAGFPQDAKPLLISDLNNVSGTQKAEIYYYLGNIYFNENKLDSAEISFKNGLTADPAYPQNSVGLIMLKMKNDLAGAEADIQTLLKQKNNKRNPDVYIAISYAYLNNNLIDKAQIYQTKAREINPKYSPVYVLEGDILAPKNLGEACSNYEMAILYDENNKEAYIKYARAYRNVNTKLAIAMLQRLKEKSPSFTLVDKELGDIYYSNNDFSNAVHYYEMYVKEGNPNIQDMTKYAMALFLNKEYQKSLDVALAGMKNDPLNPALNRLAMYNYVELKQTDNALKAADILFNKSNKPEFTYLDYFYYSQVLKDTKQYKLAADELKKAIALDSTRVELWKEISDIYNQEGDYVDAIDAYQQFIKTLPDASQQTAETIFPLGKLYYSLGNDANAPANVKKDALMKADSLFAKVSELRPDDYLGYFWRARTNSALDPETSQGLAKPYYEKTVSLLESKNDPRFNSALIECYSYLGYYTLLQKDFTKSLEYWNKILKIDPNNATANKAIEGINVTKKGK